MKDLLLSDIKNFRYERKFFIETLPKDMVEAAIRLHPAMFSEIYHQRTVNNIYLDTFNLRHYSDNINGADRRLKVRVRWYGNLFGFIEKPILELKLKHNLHVGKLLYPLKSYTLDNNFSIDVMRGVFKQLSFQESLRLHLMELNLSLLNSYNRKYFLSSDRKYRITLDADMKIYKLLSYQNNFLCKAIDCSIIELKYNKLQDNFADSITNHFPFRITRSSKYADGIAKLYA